MRCEVCKQPTRVVNTLYVEDGVNITRSRMANVPPIEGDAIVRRRKCKNADCKHLFTTVEKVA